MLPGNKLTTDVEGLFENLTCKMFKHEMLGLVV
jgi:hypothetical protein